MSLYSIRTIKLASDRRLVLFISSLLCGLQSVSQFIERDCFIRQRVVQNVMWVAQYFLKQFVISTVD